MAIDVKVEGLPELKRVLAKLPEKIRKQAVRKGLREAGKIIQSAAKMAAPVLQVPTKYRKPGTVKKAITVRNSKFARKQGNEGVFVSVRPLNGKRQQKLGKASAKNPNDPFYWRFLEFGTRKMSARPFMRPAVDAKGDEAIQRFMTSAVTQIEKLNK